LSFAKGFIFDCVTYVFHVCLSGLVGIACVILLELHSVNAMDYCAKLDEEKMRWAAKQYAIKTFNALSPEERTA